MTAQSPPLQARMEAALSSPHNNPALRCPILLVMAKQPAAGRTKTRLVPPLTSESAASLYHCFLQDILTTVRAAADRIDALTPAIAYTPSTAEDFFHQLAPDFWLIPQQSRDAHRSDLRATVGRDKERPRGAADSLGDRLQHVLSAALEQRYRPVAGHHRGVRQAVAINSDSPTLPLELLCAAFQRLDDPQVDAVFGPCTDGGYYLIGIKKPPGRLVTGVQMSTPSVLQDTLAIAADEGARVELLPEWYDVDGADDLERLRIELAAHPERAPRTSRFLLTSDY